MATTAWVVKQARREALVKQYARLFEMEGVKLSFTEDAMASVAKRSRLLRPG